jgi:hypothetical protein
MVDADVTSRKCEPLEEKLDRLARVMSAMAERLPDPEMDREEARGWRSKLLVPKWLRNIPWRAVVKDALGLVLAVLIIAGVGWCGFYVGRLTERVLLYKTGLCHAPVKRSELHTAAFHSNARIRLKRSPHAGIRIEQHF